MPRSLYWTAALACTVSAGSLWADCPSRADLDRGLIFEFQEQDNRGRVESLALYHRAAGEGLIAVADHPQLTGDPWERLETAGVILKEAQRKSGAQRLEVTLDDALAAALPPVANTEIRGTATWRSATAAQEVAYVLRSGAEMDITIGECTYPAFPLQLTEARLQPDGNMRETTRAGHYIPELSFFLIPPRRSVAGYTKVRTPRFVERFSWPFRGL
ncbi:hypothetical protein [Primorskyibacter sp. S187A]|uniref:hypothetical protein n=1 Tax=Primorskyibacter sp. S187A TaxID=3415130 RepID=UPI003C7C82DC